MIQLMKFIKIFHILILCLKYSHQGCSPPPDIIGGVFEPLQPTYKYQEQIQYRCLEGYTYKSGALNRTCQGIAHINAWLWSGQSPQCALVDCGQPTITNAYYEAPQVTTYQATMRYRCSEGWAPMNYQQALCTADAVWEFTPCREPEFHCPPPPPVSHARPNVSQSRQQHGTAIHYLCNDGYTLHGDDRILKCEKTSWVGDVPTCVAVDPVHYQSTTEQMKKSNSEALDKNVLPIVAGVVTAVLLTAILTVTVLCLRRRQSKPAQEAPESIISASPVTASTPTQHRHSTNTDPLKICENARNSGVASATDLSLPYHRIHCLHTHQPIPADYRKRNNYVPDSSLAHFRPLVSNYEQTQSSSPSTVQSELSVTDSEFHTIRECLGDFKNNNLATAANASANTQQTVHLCNSMKVQQAHPDAGLLPPSNRCLTMPTTVTTRTLWTADGRSYEAVTCPHGVEHVYQPLEHIYEEPHIWMRPLPDPQQ